ncbi:MAG TPA: ATP-dependent protease LonB [Firmicutes bacterium]|uniref:endopeptidase La n=1 Tax=Capillibacterium thermochitinicola TaxID=2699427 RepID=A0A8J6HYY3_9FIRM|nr:ATP-dependent protease LonB [Capillibacterium thermochitinicola]MBA2132238.1 ATP-dependent protease LonB [Capillibacterium thermochitinicola]HHW12904.1 ATP-dependent protease LonB [Bacillota bacterium]
MNYAGSILGLINLFFAIVIGLYFWNLLRAQQGTKIAVDREAKKELEKLHRLRAISLTEPLAEKTRPTKFDEIIGQEDGLKALRAALCGPNPQHLLIYGPPGVGKTAAARVVLEEAKQNPLSPLKPNAKFIEVDATTARFDERGIADPLIGSVHDPIYQGAGPMGMAGIPQPKPGAVTKAHGGILFIDEIGELHPYQMNKLLKVLEDRKVFFESAYYSSEDHNIPSHIHDIFQNGLPADFRLIGATTRQPHEIPAALRSRCVEVFFRALTPEEIQQIALNAIGKIGFELEEGCLEIIGKYAHNGRDSVNMVQLAAGVALTEGRKLIQRKDLEWVVNSGQYTPRPHKKVPPKPQVGCANGLAVYGPNQGMLVALEATAIPVAEGPGRVIATGVIEEEEMGEHGRTIRRRSTAKESVENVLTILKKHFNLDCTKYDLHINFPGGIPLDGPSAGIALVTVVYSALTGKPVDNLVAMTGEVSILGTVLPVGGIVPKIKAAKEAGAKRVLIPAENWQDSFADETGIEIIPVRRIEEVIQWAFRPEPVAEKEAVDHDAPQEKYIPVQSGNQGGKEELVVAAGG